MSSSASRAWMASGRPARRAARIWARKFSCCTSRGRAVVEVVQAGLADADDPGMAGHGGDVLRRRDRRFGGVVRMDADGAPEVRAAPRSSPAGVRDWASVVPMVTISPTPAAAARASTVGTFGLGEVVEVAVGIDQHQASLRHHAAGRRSAGTRPAAPADGDAVGQRRRRRAVPSQGAVASPPGTPS